MIAHLLLTVIGKPKVETLFFVTSDCPISARYSPEINRIVKEFGDVSSFQIEYEDQGVPLGSLQAHQKEFGIKTPFSLDFKHGIAKQYKVIAVPTALVRNAKGEVLYMGRIDDAYGKDFHWHPVKQADLRNALSAIKAGKTVSVKSTAVIGCTISY